MHDNDAEATENLIVELCNNDSAVIVPAGRDIVIVNISDMPNPFGKEGRLICMVQLKYSIIVPYHCEI